MHFLTVAAVVAVIALVVAHQGDHKPLSQSELVRRASISKRCEASVAAMNSKRWQRHNERRSLAALTSVVITTEAPYYEHIQNDTCVTSPEVVSGPYVWAPSQTLRQDITEDQHGIPLFLDIGVINTKTCEPLENVLIDLWYCNASGTYSSYEDGSANLSFLQLLAADNITVANSSYANTVLPATSKTTYLRGLWPTDANGMMEMKTIFPGFYSNRTIHIHAELHANWILRDNGTIVTSEKINTVQMYFDEGLTEYIITLEPYSQHTQIVRTTNAEDMVFALSSANGYNPVMSVVPLDGKDVANGMVAYFTLGVEA